jgi:hypothetical protein
MKISKSLALVFQHEGNVSDAIDLIERCIEL